MISTPSVIIYNRPPLTIVEWHIYPIGGFRNARHLTGKALFCLPFYCLSSACGIHKHRVLRVFAFRVSAIEFSEPIGRFTYGFMTSPL